MGIKVFRYKYLLKNIRMGYPFAVNHEGLVVHHHPIWSIYLKAPGASNKDGQFFYAIPKEGDRVCDTADRLIKHILETWGDSPFEVIGVDDSCMFVTIPKILDHYQTSELDESVFENNIVWRKLAEGIEKADKKSHLKIVK